MILAFRNALGLDGSKLETLVDDFNDNSRNVNLWPGSYGTLSETGGKAVITCDVNYNAYESGHAWQLDESGILFQVTPPVSTTAQLSFAYAHDTVSGTDISFYLNMAVGELYCNSQVGYSDAARTTLTYNSTDHAWLRIRETADVLYWQTSPDGETWTTRRSLATPTWVRTHTTGLFYMQGYQPSGSSTFTVDNMNVLPRTFYPHPDLYPSGLQYPATPETPAAPPLGAFFSFFP